MVTTYFTWGQRHRISDIVKLQFHVLALTYFTFTVHHLYEQCFGFVAFAFKSLFGLEKFCKLVET